MLPTLLTIIPTSHQADLQLLELREETEACLDSVGLTLNLSKYREVDDATYSALNMQEFFKF